MSSTSSHPHWGRTQSGQLVSLYTLVNRHGMEAKISNYGGIVVSLTAPNREGQFDNVVLGYEKFSDYESRNAFFGCITGRYANRIAKGRFTLNGKTHQLSCNQGPHHLHGGKCGFDKQVWNAFQPDAQTLSLTHTSADGDEGYPGTVQTTVTYRLNDENTFTIEYLAITDRPTIINLTNHTYFNLSGNKKESILDHELTLFASHYTPTDKEQIPTGKISSVIGTPLDFTSAQCIGNRILEHHPDLLHGHGFDHNFILDENHIHHYKIGTNLLLKPAALLHAPDTGRFLEIRTSQPAVQFYTGNHLGKNSIPHPHRSGLCLETQHYPDSPNHPHFPDTTLQPGQNYHHLTEYHFTTETL